MKFFQFIKLARKRLVGFKKGEQNNYVEFQEFQAKEILNELRKRKIDLSKMNVLELGVGSGGYSIIFKENSNDLTINDIGRPYILNLEDNSFDFVFCCSLIEHIPKPDMVIKEIRRVLKPKGYLYMSFPPFYSPVGGHFLKPFHLLGEKLCLKIYNWLKKDNIKSFATMYDRNYGNYGLHRTTIRKAKKMLKDNEFIISSTWTRFSPVNTAKIPFLNEIITWHVCFLGKNQK